MKNQPISFWLVRGIIENGVGEYNEQKVDKLIDYLTGINLK